jgi:TonB family protein
VEKSGMTEMEKAKQSYLLMDFRSAIKNYSVFLEKDPIVQFQAEARFYKGRAHEELGETDEAIMEYRKVMRIDSSKIWARQANRRMLMLGEFYEQQKQVADEAKKQLEAYQDQMFISKVEKYSSLVSQSSLKGELMKSSSQGNGNNTSNDSIMRLINQIGNLDLSGEQDAKNGEQLEQIRKEMVSNGKLSLTEIKELDRKQNLAQNPYRRPGNLKSAIDENSNELRYIYNKKLRSGTKLSGKMLLEILIKADGNVGNVRILQSNMGDQSFEQDILKRISTWKFKTVPDSLGDLKVNYPFEFYEEQL